MRTDTDACLAQWVPAMLSDEVLCMLPQHRETGLVYGRTWLLVCAHSAVLNSSLLLLEARHMSVVDHAKSARAMVSALKNRVN